jgi:hypothetical protein
LRDAHFPEVQINSFLAYLVRIGLEEEKLRIEEDKLRKQARLENAARLQITQSKKVDKPNFQNEQKKVEG